MKVSVRVPATTANIGPGFDCLGIALPIYNEITVEETVMPGSGIEINIIDEKLGTQTIINDYIMSVDEKIVVLRQRLHAGHADTCPLCGQHIDSLLSVDDFSDILTPLQQREQEAKCQLENAMRKRDADKTAYDKAKGSLETKKQEQVRTAETIGKEESEITKLAEKLALVVAGNRSHRVMDLLCRINEATEVEKDHIRLLDAKLQKAEEMQRTINKHAEEKKPLDAMLRQADLDLSAAQNAVINNNNQIIEQEKTLVSYQSDLGKLVAALTSALSAYCPKWQDDILATRQQLIADAEEYVAKKNQAEQKAQEIGRCEAMLSSVRNVCNNILTLQPDWSVSDEAIAYMSENILEEWTRLYSSIGHQRQVYDESLKVQKSAAEVLAAYFATSGKTEQDLIALATKEQDVAEARKFVQGRDSELQSRRDAINEATAKITALLKRLEVEKIEKVPMKENLQALVNELNVNLQVLAGKMGSIEERLNTIRQNEEKVKKAKQELDKATAVFDKWDRLNNTFGGTRFRTLVQTYILRPLLNNANIYLERITDRYRLTCSEVNQQLSILILDRYNKNQVRSATVLSGGECFMISLALSLALSSLNRQDMNVNILFIDEGFGTLDEANLNSVMSTLERLQEIAGQTNRRVGIISHREELVDRIPVKINVRKKGEGRSVVEITQDFM